MKTLKLILPVLILLPFCTLAQSHKAIGEINYDYIPVKLGDTSATAKLFNAEMAFPIFKKQSSSLNGKVQFGSMTFKNFPESAEESLYSIEFQAAYTHKFDSLKSITLFGKLGIYSDMEDISIEDFRGTIGFQYKIRKNARYLYGVGAAYSNQFFGHQISPFITIDYHPSKNWYLYGQIPTDFRIEYALTEKDYLAFGIRGVTNSYRLSDKTGPGRYNNSSFIQTSQWSTKLYYERFVFKNWSVNLSAGYAISQNFRQYNNISGSMLDSWTILTIPVGKKRPDPAVEIKKPGMLYSVGIKYNIFTNRK